MSSLCPWEACNRFVRYDAYILLFRFTSGSDDRAFRDFKRNVQSLHLVRLLLLIICVSCSCRRCFFFLLFFYIIASLQIFIMETIHLDLLSRLCADFLFVTCSHTTFFISSFFILHPGWLWLPIRPSKALYGWRAFPGRRDPGTCCPSFLLFFQHNIESHKAFEESFFQSSHVLLRELGYRTIDFII